jgi:hypothetical protein
LKPVSAGSDSGSDSDSDSDSAADSEEADSDAVADVAGIGAVEVGTMTQRRQQGTHL